MMKIPPSMEGKVHFVKQFSYLFFLVFTLPLVIHFFVLRAAMKRTEGSRYLRNEEGNTDNGCSRPGGRSYRN
jgi:hypothetical protein